MTAASLAESMSPGLLKVAELARKDPPARFGALAYLAVRTIPRWRYRAAAVAFAGTMILSISASRIYLGVHWISDVGAGICAGLIWVIAATVAYETMRRIRMVRSLRAKRDAQTTSSLRT